MKRTLFASVLLFAAGCAGGGGGGGGGGFSDSGGTGTMSLKVTAAIAVQGGAFDTANVAVADAASSVVSGATVTLTTPTQVIPLVESPVGFGVYVLPSGTFAYESGYRLDVDKGADHADAISILAPTATVVTSPASQANLPNHAPIDVAWNGRGADDHRLELLINHYDSDWTAGDTGSATIGAATVNTAGVETLTLRRRKIVPITAGRPGSQISIELKDTVSPIAIF
jgi:hypothetical protein